MLYGFLQWVGAIALHWFYRGIRVVHGERIPVYGPLLVAVNHQNALVDAILAQWVVPRPLRITAKATLGEGLLGAMLIGAAGIIPLRRTSDERDPASDPARNRRSFERIIEELRRNQAILVFPEGKSHNEREIAPLKTGLARAALRARESGVSGIHIVPIGLTFESKAEPGTVVVAQVGEVLRLDEWQGDSAHALTELIAERLGAVSFTGDVGTAQEQPGRVRYAQSPLARLAAAWGRATHRIPMTLARELALRQSRDEGELAMYTITYGVALTLIAYAIQVPVMWLLAGGTGAVVYLFSLVIGAYYAAYADHRD